MIGTNQIFDRYHYTFEDGHSELAVRRAAMLIVTPQAKQKLVEALHENTHDPCVAIRITVNPKAPRQLDLILDKEKRGDFVVKTNEGLKLLLIQAHLASRLDGLVLDYEEGLQDFVIAELTRH